MTSLNRLALDSNPELCGSLPSEWTADPPAVHLILTFDTRIGLTCLPRSNSTSVLIPEGEQQLHEATHAENAGGKAKMRNAHDTHEVHTCLLRCCPPAYLLPIAAQMFAVWCALYSLTRVFLCDASAQLVAHHHEEVSPFSTLPR